VTEPELPPELVADLLDERVRWDDLQSAQILTQVRSWDEVDFDFSD
jgi:hypothetical protein